MESEIVAVRDEETERRTDEVEKGASTRASPLRLSVSSSLRLSASPSLPPALLRLLVFKMLLVLIARDAGGVVGDVREDAAHGFHAGQIVDRARRARVHRAFDGAV